MKGGKVDLPIVSIEGKAYDRGYRYGRQAREGVKANVDIYLELIRCFSGIDRDEIIEEARGIIPAIEGYDPDIMEEIRGISEGAGLGIEEIVALNARYELMFLRRACTSFAVTPDATSSGHTLVGQNWDWSPSLRDTCVVLKIRQDGGRPSILCFTEAGIIGGKIGLNSAGIALCINGLLSDRDGGRTKTPFFVVCRGILDSKSLSEAIESATRAEMSRSANCVIAHAGGGAIDLEVAPHDFGWIYPENGILVHSNHFESRLGVKDIGKRRWPDTLVRYGRIRGLLRKRVGSVDVETLKQALRDHFNWPHSICHHIDERANESKQSMTVASIIMDLNDRRMHVVYPGPPCMSEYEAVSLGA